MKSVLISIQPKWCELIASGKKTVEVRKTRPKTATPFKCYIYCTSSKKRIRCSKHLYAYEDNLCLSNGKVKMCGGYEFLSNNVEYERLNGKVIGEFICNCITSLKANKYVQAIWNDLEETCLTSDEIIDYATDGKPLYYWHISDLVIYDKPKELSEFSTRKLVYNGLCGKIHKPLPLQRPPQSWCYVEGGE